MKSLILAVAVGAAALASPAVAADLGGACCADLEERIAELEVTAARKGNRKVSVVVYGRINKAITYIDTDDFSDTRVLGDNTTNESFVGLRGEAKIGKDLSAGYVLEIQEFFDYDGGGLNDSDGVGVRQSYAYIKSAYGQVSVGKQSTATDDIFLSSANTDAVLHPLTSQPLFGLEPFEGFKANVVRYNSPVFEGFMLSASWGEDDSKDIALRFAKVVGDFKLYAAAGYRETDDYELSYSNDDKVISLAASGLHVPTGLFASAYYGSLDLDGYAKVDAYQVVGGVEREIFGIGKTTVFASYGEASDLDLKLYGIGVVQALGDNGVDLYLSGNRVEGLLGSDIDSVTGGMRINF